MELKLSELKELRELLNDDASNLREAVENMQAGENDFEVDNYRFISDSAIDDIMQEELGSDLYILGCFNASFLASVLDIDQDVIEAMQKAEAYEAIGKLVVSMGMLGELQRDYASADGHGHHFNHYDGNEVEFHDYHIFQTN